MNKRYTKRIDIWFRSYNDARRFGIRKIKYHVLESA
jgi:3D (Asp-Asp-Asp) domain-containing protein